MKIFALCLLLCPALLAVPQIDLEENPAAFEKMKAMAVSTQKVVKQKRSAAFKVVRDALADKSESRNITLLEAAKKTLPLLDGVSTHQAKLKAAIEQPETLNDVLSGFYQDLVFKPTVEAKSPVGFPAYTPVGFMEVKHYPTHRLARASMGGAFRDQRAFFKLFNHIKSNNIPMTSPVPVERKKDGTQTMAFLYEDGDKEPDFIKDGVEVIDVDPVTVVSIGLRGYDRKSIREQSLKALRGWLANNKDWEAAGGWRTMGWNGPYVSRNKRYWEVQIPVRLKKTSPAEKGTTL